MKRILFKIVLKLKIIIDILVNKLNYEECITSHNTSCEVENQMDNDYDSIIKSVQEVLNNDTYENYYNNILSDINEEDNDIKNEKYIEEIISYIVDLEIDIECNNISNYVDEEEVKENYQENYNRADIRAIFNDKKLTDKERIYLIKLIANINREMNCVDMSISQLMNLFNSKNKTQVLKKIDDLENAGVIKKISSKKGNKYYILKHVKVVSSSVNDNKESLKNDTSINSDTFKYKEIQRENIDNEIFNVVVNNINNFKKGLEWNQEYLNNMVFKNNILE